jgi:hypothetical protein
MEYPIVKPDAGGYLFLDANMLSLSRPGLVLNGSRFGLPVLRQPPMHLPSWLTTTFGSGTRLERSWS